MAGSRFYVAMVLIVVNTGFAFSKTLAEPDKADCRVGLTPPRLVKENGGASPTLRFDFGSGKIEPNYIQVTPDTVYTKELGYGFEPPFLLSQESRGVTMVDRGGEDALRSDFCTADSPFLFSIRLPEGNYKVTVTLGDKDGESTTTIKAELRRLMFEKVHTKTGKFETRKFLINIRTPNISIPDQVGDGQVRLKDREKTTEFAAWDDKLTLEFNDARPCVCALEIEKVDVPTIYLLGDSTVCDQPLEPWNSWGQMLPRFFKPEAAIANHAESGESLRSSLAAGQLDKVLSLMKPGDYLFIQYGHIDMKEKGEGVSAFTPYKKDLKHFIAQTRKKGGTPILVTSMERKDGVVKNTLGDYPEAVRQTAKEEKVDLIDLNTISKIFYKALGENIDKAFQDGTHHNNYGSYELAKCVVECIKTANSGDLAKYIVDDFKGFDPNNPDPVEGFIMPASPGSLSSLRLDKNGRK